MTVLFGGAVLGSAAFAQSTQPADRAALAATSQPADARWRSGELAPLRGKALALLGE